MNKLHSALEWAANGWPVFPVIENGKIPAIKGGHNLATTDIDKIKAWEWDGNIGVRPPKGVLLIDVDVRGERTLEDSEAWKRLTASLKNWDGLTASLSQWTQSDGYHVAIGIPEGCTAKNATDVFGTKVIDGSAVDLRTDRGYFVGAPSSIYGKQYRLTSNGIVPALGLPTPSINLFRQLVKDNEVQQTVTPGVHNSQPKNLLIRNSIKKWRCTIEEAIAIKAIDLSGNRGFEIVASTLASAIRDEGHKAATVLELFHDVCRQYPNYDPAREEGRLLSFAFNRYAERPRTFGTLKFLIEQQRLQAALGEGASS